MQIVAKPDEISALMERHEEVVLAAIADMIVTESERIEIARSARRVKLAIYAQATRNRIAIRMIRGGGIDRHITGEISDYLKLQEQEKTAFADQALAA